MLPGHKLGVRRIAVVHLGIVVVVLHKAEDQLLDWRCRIELPKQFFESTIAMKSFHSCFTGLE